MRSLQVVLKKPTVTGDDLKSIVEIQPNLVLVFGSVKQFTSPEFGATIKNTFANCTVIGCTTAGEISNQGVSDNTTIFTGIRFEKTKIRSATARLNGADKCFATGAELVASLKAPDLKSVFVLGQGVNVNGTPLVDGIRSVVGEKVTITGGLAGDGGAFKETWVLLNGEVSNQTVAAFGLYGDSIEVSCGSLGGWKPFGPVRRVTKAVNNVLFQIDGESALAVYKKYLGDDAKDLPGSGLRFPFALLDNNEAETGLIRTILAIDEKAGSLTFAGDIPEGSLVRLMHSDVGSLVMGAKGAAETSKKNTKNQDGVGILVSCVGRKLVMGDDVDEEVETVQEALGAKNPVTGFYSYGEISPMNGFTSDCKLHNQTMTITWLSEKAS